VPDTCLRGGDAISRSQPKQAPRERFDELWAAHYAHVFAFALRRVGDHSEAEEIAVETFVVVWRRLDAVPEAPLPWLYGVTRRVLANHRRSQGRRRRLIARLVASGHASPTLTVEPEHDEAIAQAFNSLSASDKEVLALVAWEELKPREAAAVIGISASRFSVRLHRAKQRLRKKLEARGHRQDDRTGTGEARAGMEL
jgi:RNA polymerase sigma factor (sigma-70 family)